MREAYQITNGRSKTASRETTRIPESVVALRSTLSDVRGGGQGLLYIRHQAFRPDLTPVAMEEVEDDHLIASAGFLDGTPQHRTYWSIDRDLRYGPATL